MQQNIKTDYQVIVNNIGGILSKAFVCLVSFYVWFFTVGHFYPIIGTVLGIVSAAMILFFMLMFQGNKIPFEDMPDEEIRHLKNDIIWQATFRAGKRLAKAYTACSLTRAIDTEFIHPTTGDKYRLIFRRTRNGERMQASHMRKPLQATEKAKENIYVETDEDWQPGQYEPSQKEYAQSVTPPPIAAKGIHEIAADVFRDT